MYCDRLEKQQEGQSEEVVGGFVRGNGGPVHVLGASRSFGKAGAQGASWRVPDNDIIKRIMKRLGYNAKAWFFMQV